MTPEGEIKKEICEYLWARGVFFWVQQAGKIPGRINRSKFLRNGVSDILGVFRGQMLAIEVKVPKGKTTDEQDRFLAEVGRNGGIAFVARSVNDVSTALNAVPLQKQGASQGQGSSDP